MEFNLSDIQHIFEADNDTKSTEVGEEVSLLTDSIENFRFEELGIAEDQAIIYAISGYIARNLIKNNINNNNNYYYLFQRKRRLSL